MWCLFLEWPLYTGFTLCLKMKLHYQQTRHQTYDLFKTLIVLLCFHMQVDKFTETTYNILVLVLFSVCLVCGLTLKAPITTKFVCFCRLLKCDRSLSDKRCRLRPDCSYRSSLIWVNTVFLYT